jgi:hypothetical protein
MKIKTLIQIVILIALSSCTNQADTTNQTEEQLMLVNYQKQVDSLNRVVADIKSNSHYCMQYRYLIRDNNTKTVVAGDDFSQNSIYCVEIYYGMGMVDYIYITYDIDDVPIIVSCIKSNVGIGDQLEYEILDKNENRIEYFYEENNKGEPQFEQKMERIFELAKNKALKLAKA